jgi:hypothetical protein
VISDDIRVGASGGFLAATATAGTMMAIGIRDSTAARPFNVVASHLLGHARADVWGFVANVTILGIVSHLVITSLLGIVVAMVARRGLAPLWAAALATAVLAALISLGIARRGGTSLASVFQLGDFLVFYLTLGVSLALGIRFAPFDGVRVHHANDM